MQILFYACLHSIILSVLLEYLTCTEMVKVACYKSMIRPILEYASTVWSPYMKKNILMIEAVQRRAARFVTNTYNQTSSVTAMLFRLGWSSVVK